MIIAFITSRRIAQCKLTGLISTKTLSRTGSWIHSLSISIGWVHCFTNSFNLQSNHHVEGANGQSENTRLTLPGTALSLSAPPPPQPFLPPRSLASIKSGLLSTQKMIPSRKMTGIWIWGTTTVLAHWWIQTMSPQSVSAHPLLHVTFGPLPLPKSPPSRLVIIKGPFPLLSTTLILSLRSPILVLVQMIYLPTLTLIWPMMLAPTLHPPHTICVRNSFVSIYFYFKLFLPTNTHPPDTCSHLRYDLTTCSLPFISFHFHHSHQVRTIANTSEIDSKIYRRQELSTREALHQAPSPIQSHIARLCQSTASTPTPP